MDRFHSRDEQVASSPRARPDRWLARLLYGRERWRGWLSLVLFDPEVLELYAARPAGAPAAAARLLPAEA